MPKTNPFIVLIPHCSLCPISQANGETENNTLWSAELRNFIFEHNINIIQLPCPEAFFDDINAGYLRSPHGFQYYTNLPGFREHCQRLVQSVLQQIITCTNAGIQILCVIGVEHSPTCATSYMYTNNGTVHQKGIFMDMLYNALKCHNINPVYIGINRQHYKKGISQLHNEIIKHLSPN